MSKIVERSKIGSDGRPLPVLPPVRDARVWARMVRVMFYTPGFLALLLLKTGEPTAFGITVELLTLACASAVVAGLFIGSQSMAEGSDVSSRVGLWSGALVLELLAVVPFLCAVPPLFHELASSTLLHARAPESINTALGVSELLPAIAVLPFMLYQLLGFGTLHFVVKPWLNWVINIAIIALIIATTASNRQGEYTDEKHFAGVLVVLMALVVGYGVMKLKQLQRDYEARVPVAIPATAFRPSRFLTFLGFWTRFFSSCFFLTADFRSYAAFLMTTRTHQTAIAA